MADPRDELAYAELANEPGWLPPREPLRIRVSPYDMPPPVDPTAAARAMWQQRYASPEPTPENQRALGKGIGALVHGASEALQIPDRMFEGVRVERDPAATWQQVDQARRQQVEGATEAALNLMGIGAPLAAGRGATVGSSGGVLRGKPGGPWEGGIRAYHSSPHDFDKFDWNKLRTGEGANSYGAGFYAAENPAVSGQGGQYWDQFTRRFAGNEKEATDWLALHNFDRQKAAQSARQQLERNVNFARGVNSQEELASLMAQRADFEKTVKLLESDKPIGPRTYEVNIAARPELMLDWDKPLAQQNPRVQEFWERQFPKRERDPTGKQIYENAVTSAYEPGTLVSAAPKVSEALREAGIPGIRYLDQGSRGAREAALNTIQMTRDGYYVRGKGDFPTWEAAKEALNIKPETYNYVVTDPSKLDILAKYGIVGGTAGGIGSVVDPSRYQPGGS